MKTFPSMAGVLACLAAFAVCEAAFGGQRPETADGDGPADAMSLEELLAYQAFHYRVDGRDPMVMRPSAPREPGRVPAASAAWTDPAAAWMEEALRQALSGAEHAIAARDYDEAIRISEETMRKVDDEWPPLQADPPSLRRMDEQIRSCRRLAVRLKARKEIDLEFIRLDVRVNGVSWSPAGARAVINSRLVEPGEALLDVCPSGDLRLETVEPRAVVFRYKGRRFRKEVALYAEADY